MFDLFERERGKLYPSWQDDKRRVWRRMISDLPLSGKCEILPDVFVYRRSATSYVATAPNNVEQSFSPRTGVKSTTTTHELTQLAISQVIAWLIEYTKEDETMTQTEKRVLTNKAVNALRAIEVEPRRKYHDGRTLRGLLENGLIREEEKGTLALTQLALDSLAPIKANTTEPVQRPGIRRPLVEHIPDPSKAPAQPLSRERLRESDKKQEDIAGQEPSFETPPEDEVEAHDETASAPAGDIVPAGAQPPTQLIEEVPPEYAVDPGRAHRILKYLMSTSPFIRDLVEQLEAVDRATERLRKLE